MATNAAIGLRMATLRRAPSIPPADGRRDLAMANVAYRTRIVPVHLGLSESL